MADGIAAAEAADERAESGELELTFTFEATVRDWIILDGASLEATAIFISILEGVNAVDVIHVVGAPLTNVQVTVDELHFALTAAAAIDELSLINVA